MSNYLLDYLLDVYLINNDIFKYLSPGFSFEQQVHCLKVSHLRNKSRERPRTHKRNQMSRMAVQTGIGLFPQIHILIKNLLKDSEAKKGYVCMCVDACICVYM